MDTDLIYGIDDRPPLKETLFAAIQHLLAIFVAIITPPLIIAGALKLDLETTGFLVSMALFASGVSTFVQCRKLGPVGAGAASDHSYLDQAQADEQHHDTRYQGSNHRAQILKSTAHDHLYRRGGDTNAENKGKPSRQTSRDNRADKREAGSLDT